MPAVVELDHEPNLAVLFAKAATTAFSHGERLPADRLVRRDVRVDRDHLAAYNRVCGFDLRDRLPLTYPHLIAFPLTMQLMAQRSFPLPLPGLVHIRNRIHASRALHAGEPLTVEVHVEDLRPHPKGRQFDVVAEAEVDGEPVWEEVGTILHRGPADDTADAVASLEHPDLPDTARWRIPSDTGRRYAKVSGDYNPIHLHPITARLFGFRRAIAHGMWLKARAVAALADRLPKEVTVEVAFRKPLLLPTTATFATATTQDGWGFAIRARDGRAHLHGETRQE